MYTEKSVGVDCTVVCLEGVPDSVLNALEVFWNIPELPSFQVSGKYSRVRSWKVGAHWKDTGNIGNNGGTWEITGVPLTTLSANSILSKSDLVDIFPHTQWNF